MRTSLLFGVLCFSTLAMWAADRPQLNVKTGLWEVTFTTTTSGTPPIPAEMLAKMTPEQRAKFEERVKARNAAPPQAHTEKECLTEEELKKETLFGSDEDDKECKRTILSSTSSKVEARVDCESDGVKRSGTMTIEALSPENVKGTMHMTAASEERAMNVNSTFAAKWLGAACGDVQ